MEDNKDKSFYNNINKVLHPFSKTFLSGVQVFFNRNSIIPNLKSATQETNIENDSSEKITKDITHSKKSQDGRQKNYEIEKEKKNVTFIIDDDSFAANLYDNIDKNIDDIDDILSKIYIKDCGFSSRVVNILLRNNIVTVAELSALSDEDLLRFRNLGKGSLDEINDFFDKCSEDKDFGEYILTLNNLLLTYPYKKIEPCNTEIPETDNSNNDGEKLAMKEMPEAYYETIYNIEGLSAKAIEIFESNNITKIGQLIQCSPETLFYDPSLYENLQDDIMLDDNSSLNPEYDILDKDIKLINNYLHSKGISKYPMKLSNKDKKKLMFYTYDEIQHYGWENIITKILKKSINTLKPKEQEILLSRFGISGETIKTLEEIGNNYNVSRERIRQIASRSINKIKKIIESSSDMNIINEMTKILFENIGSIYKIKDVEKFKNVVTLIKRFDADFNFIIDEKLYCVVTELDWYEKLRQRFFDKLECENKIIGSIVLFRNSLCEILDEYLSKDTEYAANNYNSIVNLVMDKIEHYHLICVDDNQYKLNREKIRGRTGKLKTNSKKEEIIALFEKLYPNGVHLPIDKNDELENNLKPLMDKLSYEISIRTLSYGIIKYSPDIVLWDKGLYIHVNNINVKWSVVDDIINQILSGFDNGLTHFSIRKIYNNNLSKMELAGIPNLYALIGLIKYKNNPRIGHKKLEVFDAYNTTRDDIDKTKLIENYLKTKDDWVSISDMQKHFCDKIGWPDYQVEQYVASSPLLKRDSRNGFIHLEALFPKLNKPYLWDLLKLLYDRTSLSGIPIRLETIRKSSFSKKWTGILGRDVTGNFMADFIDSLNLKNSPLIFYQGSAYPGNYETDELSAKYSEEDIFKYYETRNLDKIYSEFKSFERETLLKIIDSDIDIATVLFGKTYDDICDYFYEHNFQNLGTLLFFPFNCIEFRKRFSAPMIENVTDKIQGWISSYDAKRDNDNATPSITDIFWR